MATRKLLLMIILLAVLAHGQDLSFSIDPLTQLQPLIGVGGAMTRASAWLANATMDPESRHRLFHRLFDLDGPAPFTAVRLPMGTCDFSVSNYTYDDLPPGATEDYELRYFSVEKDLDFLIPILKEVLAINPTIRIVASPWSAPAWMKTSQSLFGGALLANDTNVYRTYAAYFRRFVEAYHEHGISIFAVTLQNEPRYETSSYPSMLVTPDQEQILGLLVAKEFEKSEVIRRKTKTRILVYDHNWDAPQYPIDVFSNATVDHQHWIAGAAFHCYAGVVAGQTVFHDRFPDKEIYFTECCGGEWAPDFGGDPVWDMQNLVIGAPQNWARSVLKWNLILDQNFGPHLPSACENCRGIITWDTATNETIFNEDYYPLAHLALAFRRDIEAAGSDTTHHRLYSSAGDSALAVLKRTQNPAAARIYVLLVNGNETTVSVSLSWNTTVANMTRCTIVTQLPAVSAATLMFDVDPHDVTKLLRSNVSLVVTANNTAARLTRFPDLAASCE